MCEVWPQDGGASYHRGVEHEVHDVCVHTVLDVSEFTPLYKHMGGNHHTDAHVRPSWPQSSYGTSLCPVNTHCRLCPTCGSTSASGTLSSTGINAMRGRPNTNCTRTTGEGNRVAKEMCAVCTLKPSRQTYLPAVDDKPPPQHLHALRSKLHFYLDERRRGRHRCEKQDHDGPHRSTLLHFTPLGHKGHRNSRQNHAHGNVVDQPVPNRQARQ